jgi:hypothetical protein
LPSATVLAGVTALAEHSGLKPGLLAADDQLIRRLDAGLVTLVIRAAPRARQPAPPSIA